MPVHALSGSSVPCSKAGQASSLSAKAEEHALKLGGFLTTGAALAFRRQAGSRSIIIMHDRSCSQPPNFSARSGGWCAASFPPFSGAMPVALIVCVQTAKTDMLKSFDVIPPLVVTGWICFGLWQLGYFQKQERIWQGALDRAKFLALINLGLSTPSSFSAQVEPDARAAVLYNPDVARWRCLGGLRSCCS